MLGRIVEIAEDNRHLSLYRGFLKVNSTEGEREELGRVPLDDISAVIANAYGISYTNNILVALANMGAPFVLCAANHNAVGMLLPIEGNYEQSKRMDAQIAASIPLKKKLWANIVKSKLEQQACVLEVIGASFIPIQALIKKIKSGDSTNIEAQAARRYWSLLFGKDFRRDRDEAQINGLLNYGYTVLRATTARAIVAAGLHPSIGLYHSNASNAMRLVDDLMEPFRPIVDLKVYQLVQTGNNEVNQETKRMLVRTMYEDMQTLAGVTPLTVCTQKLATSLALVMLKERDKLDLPLRSLPILLT